MTSTRMLGSAVARSSLEPRRRCGPPLWARWNDELDQRYTLGVEEEVMLLEPANWSLAQSSDEVLARLSDDLALHTSAETHAAVLELITGVQPDVHGILTELDRRRHQLARELRDMGLTAAVSGTHPLDDGAHAAVSGAARYRLVAQSMRLLALREPTMALHVHVGVPCPEDAVRLLNALRRSAPILLALSANSPFCRGRDAGFASARTVIFQAFPRTGLPRVFASYADYVDAVDVLISSGAIPDPSFLWWDVRPQPTLGTVEVRIMDAQTVVADVAALVALVQSLARLELEGDAATAEPSDEVLAENRFLAARDGMDARLIDPATHRLVAVRETLAALLDRCRPHALKLGCAPELERVSQLAANNGVDRQRAIAARGGTLDHLTACLAHSFLTPYLPQNGRVRDVLRVGPPCPAGR
jgi:glutamate---cysteine ligase / carboxylate-amine ligase